MIHALLIIIFIGVLCWAFNLLVPIDGRFKQVVIGIGCLIAFIVLLQAFGIDTGFNVRL